TWTAPYPAGPRWSVQAAATDGQFHSHRLAVTSPALRETAARAEESGSRAAAGAGPTRTSAAAASTDRRRRTLARGFLTRCMRRTPDTRRLAGAWRGWGTA